MGCIVTFFSYARLDFVMKFQYFTYFLNPSSPQRSLFPEKRDKNEFLTELLVQDHEFVSHGRQVAYVFLKKIDGFILGKFGVKRIRPKYLPPRQQFHSVNDETWPYCNVIIDTSPRSGDGQKIYFEIKKTIFSSADAQLKRFAGYLNGELKGYGYLLAINPVSEVSNFWSVIDASPDQIEKLTFAFNVPNLFELNSKLEDDLKGARDTYGPTKVTLQMENPEGKLVIPRDALMEQGVDYISRGGGEYKLKIKGRVISSTSKVKTKQIEDLDIDLATADAEIVKKIISDLIA